MWASMNISMELKKKVYQKILKRHWRKNGCAFCLFLWNRQKCLKVRERLGYQMLLESFTRNRCWNLLNFHRMKLLVTLARKKLRCHCKILSRNWATKKWIVLEEINIHIGLGNHSLRKNELKISDLQKWRTWDFCHINLSQNSTSFLSSSLAVSTYRL